MKVIVCSVIAALLMWMDNPVGAFAWMFLAGIYYERIRYVPSREI